MQDEDIRLRTGFGHWLFGGRTEIYDPLQIGKEGAVVEPHQG
jgi:hypothetical protein